jgi:hypothetical protein
MLVYMLLFQTPNIHALVLCMAADHGPIKSICLLCACILCNFVDVHKACDATICEQAFAQLALQKALARFSV